MKFDVRKAVARGQFEGDLSFEFAGDNGLITLPYTEFSSPVKAQLRFEIDGDEVEFTGEIAFTLKGACSRCLKETEQSFTGEVEARYLPQKTESEDYSYRGGVIDLTDCLADAVMIALPSKLLCGENCVPPAWRD